jgi:folate-dependent phosphoribosylglycinamide formyltransferase PurN
MGDSALSTQHPALKLAWFSTGRGPGSFAALSGTVEAIEAGRLPVTISVLFCNREQGEAEPTDRFLAYARTNGIAVETLSSVRFRKAAGGERSQPGQPLPAWRTTYDQDVAERLSAYDFELGVLFGYMLITTAPLCRRWTLLNEHPALPDGPTGAWQQVIHQLIDEGATESGCMIHLGTEDLDRGPVVSYCRYSLQGPPFDALRESPDPHNEDGPLFVAIRQAGLQREVPLLHETLRLVATGGLPASAVDLTQAVEASLDDTQSSVLSPQS